MEPGRLIPVLGLVGALSAIGGLFVYGAWVRRPVRTPTIDQADLNLRICASGSELRVIRARRGAALGHRVSFRVLAEDGPGGRYGVTVTVDDDRLDAGSKQIAVAWERGSAATEGMLSDDPLWDDGLDGGPVA